MTCGTLALCVSAVRSDNLYRSQDVVQYLLTDDFTNTVKVALEWFCQKAVQQPATTQTATQREI